MTYAIIAVVLLVVVLLFALMSRKSADTDQSAQGSQSASKPAQKVADSRPKSTRPPPTPAEKAKRSEPPPGEPTSPRADERPSPAAAREEPGAAAAAPAHPRDIAGLRKGLAKARGEGGFFGRLASLFAGKKELDPDHRRAGRGNPAHLRRRRRDDAKPSCRACAKGSAKNELASSQAVWDALRADATRILGIGGGQASPRRTSRRWSSWSA